MTITDLDGQILNLNEKMIIVEKSGSFMIDGADDNFKIIQKEKTMLFGDKVGGLISTLCIQRDSLENKNLSDNDRLKINENIEKTILNIVTLSLTIKKKIQNTAYVIKI